ncbi:ATP-binding cassette domain-containing protein [Vagococcus bubulae]|uniref:ABC transporter domain-containing protein n=1 Tax=Vagococcus bubulae TaxID=1977868 RepID=A0A429ZEZ2_9ENTE|nr:ATP-binding cassette domain-containing protein [Vagococcus bubulae]RST92225.1 hypothetical protein CBF36_09065 [Vagococcus bubulae]
MIKLENIRFAYKNKPILVDITQEFHAGEIIGLVAPNGTGKSTLLNVLMNYNKPQKGQLIIDGTDTYKTAKDQINLYKKISMMPDQQDLYESKTGMEHLSMYKAIWHSTIDIKRLVIELHMTHYVNDNVSSYSLGMRQRLCFAMQIVTDTKIMLMDEVMNGLDPTNVTLISMMMSKKRDEGKLIFIASHLLDNLESYADRIFFLINGQLELFYDKSSPHQNGEKFLKINVTDSSFLPDSLLSRGILLSEDRLIIPLEKEEEHTIFNDIPVEKMQTISVSRLTLKEAYEIKFGLNKKN